MAGLRLQIRVFAPGLVGDPKGPIVPAIAGRAVEVVEVVEVVDTVDTVDTVVVTDGWRETFTLSLAVVSRTG